jgi:DNA/RNA-binding domain of Phe-tRNA-synthetase-like protein
VRLTFHQDVLERFPGMRVIVVVARGIDGTVPRPAVDRRLTEAWATSARTVEPYGNAQSHPNVAPWRARLKGAGANPHDFPSSVEALLRRAAKGGEPPRINPLVDFYNALSLSLVVPVGGFDLGALGGGDIDVRRTVEGDTFLALDADEPAPVPAGEVAYVQGSTVLTRHLVWRQSKPGLIRHTTTDVVLLCEILAEVRLDLLDDVRSGFDHGLRMWFAPTSLSISVLDASSPELREEPIFGPGSPSG